MRGVPCGLSLRLGDIHAFSKNTLAVSEAVRPIESVTVSRIIPETDPNPVVVLDAVTVTLVVFERVKPDPETMTQL